MFKQKTILTLLLSTALWAHAQYPYEEYSLRISEFCEPIKSEQNQAGRAYQRKQYGQAQTAYASAIQNAESCQAVLRQIPDEKQAKAIGSKLNVLYNHAALAYLKDKQYTMAKLHLEQADPKNSETKNTQQQLQQALARSPKKQTAFAGEYIQYAGIGVVNSIGVLPIASQQWQVVMDLVSPLSMKQSINTGEGSWTSSVNKIDSHTLVIKDQSESYMDCQITMHFKPDHLVVETDPQHSACGFGGRVSANGIFWKK